MTTETSLCATIDQARELIEALKRAISESVDLQRTSQARVVLEQVNDQGPWRLIIHVLAPEENP